MRAKTAMAGAIYVEVALEDIEKFLKRAFRVLRPTQDIVRGEICYDMKLGKFAGIRVWTSVHRGQSTGAGVGADAIRVGLISLKDKGPLEKGKLPIVKRTKNWKDSLKDRVEDCIEKYEEKDEFWEQWAETRKRQEYPTRAEHAPPVHVEDPGRDEDGEGDGPNDYDPPPAPVLKPPVPARQYDPDRMQGGITDKQVNFLRILMRGMSPARWRASGAALITGLDSPPSGPNEVRGLSKGQASKLIDVLKSSGAAGARYAAELEALEASYARYDRRV